MFSPSCWFSLLIHFRYMLNLILFRTCSWKYINNNHVKRTHFFLARVKEVTGISAFWLRHVKRFPLYVLICLLIEGLSVLISCWRLVLIFWKNFLVYAIFLYAVLIFKDFLDRIIFSHFHLRNSIDDGLPFMHLHLKVRRVCLISVGS